MLHMFISDIFDAEVVNDEDGHDWPPLVLPEAWSGGCLELPFLVQSGVKEII
jgi:hypothetical protein